jgi:predicted DNA-binding transcriptional regulator AlpA
VSAKTKPEHLDLHLGYLREKQIIPHIFPVSRADWWKGVKEGRYPAGLKISEKVTVWRKEDIQEMLRRLDRESERVGVSS